MFNQNSRTSNVAKSSAVGTACSVVNILLGFVYRTIFIFILGAAYLGINGLFTSILLALSLADLGVTTAIVYRFYEPISSGDVHKVGELMNFFKVVYRVIAAAILVLGLILVPFLGYFIHDASEIPSDVNLTVVYLLFLVQTAATYLWSYRLTILDADQRGYTSSLIQLVISIARYVVQALALLITLDFTISLAVGIVCTLAMNIALSHWVTTQYPEVFAVAEMLAKPERRQIYRDTLMASCHKLGSVVLDATDNIVLSAFVGIITTGLYANYSIVITSLTTVMKKLLGGFTGSLGSAHVELSAEDNYTVFKRLTLVNFAFTGLTTACLFLLVDDFIQVWLGADYLLDKLAVAALCLYFFLNTNRLVNGSYTAGVGLFMKDWGRPFIEAVINIVVSIVLVLKVGIAGVFLGTSISFLATVFWREPYILHRDEFHKPLRGYWVSYALTAAFTVAFCAAASALKGLVAFPLTWLTWVGEAAAIVVVFTVLFALVFGWVPEARYFWGKLLKR